MRIKDKYINPFTDFGFKKLFDEAEIAKYSDEEYENSLKGYRDLKNTIDTAFDEGKFEGKVEGKIETAIELKKMKFPVKKISKVTGLSIEEIEKLQI